ESFEMVIEPDPEFPPVQLEMTQGMEHQRHGIRGNLLQWHSMKRVAAVAEALTGGFERFDLALWGRPDLYYWDRLHVPRSRGALYLPDHDSWGAVNDRFSIGEPELV